MNSPCYQCEDRKLNCHSKCNQYKSFKDSLSKNREYEKDKQYHTYLKEKGGAIWRMKHVRA